MPRFTPKHVPCGAMLATLLLSACSTVPPAPLYQRLSEQDTQLADDTARLALETLPSGQTRTWFNPTSGNRGDVTPGATWFIESRGQYCRAYQERIFIGQQTARYEDVACRNARGVWVAYP